MFADTGSNRSYFLIPTHLQKSECEQPHIQKSDLSIKARSANVANDSEVVYSLKSRNSRCLDPP